MTCLITFDGYLYARILYKKFLQMDYNYSKILHDKFC